nr:MAG TPA: Terminase DNA packaging enzyme small [Caudoviricetes sp.]
MGLDIDFENLSSADELEKLLNEKLEDLESIKRKTDISDVEVIVDNFENKTLKSDISDITEITPSEVIEQKESNKNKISIELFNLKLMIDDYKKVRESLLENVDNTQKIVNSITSDIFNEENASADKITAYANLVTAVNSSIKLLTASYKDISSILLNLKKLEQESKKDNNKDIKIENINIISTTDLIKQLQDNKKLIQNK